MDHSRNSNQRCGYHSDTPEPEYAVVDDQEEVLNVCILPARPIDEEMEYADRDLPRSSSAPSFSSLSTDGAFLVRDCSVNIDREPLVLSVYHEKKVYNVKIRFIESTSKFILGTGQRSNDMFDSVADIIKFHTIFPIVLISGRNTPGSKYPENCVLTRSVTRRDVDQLLQ